MPLSSFDPQSSRALRNITAAEQRTFEEDGVVLLKGIYPNTWVDRLRDCLEDIFAMDEARADLPNPINADSSGRGARSDMIGLARSTAAKQGAIVALDGGTLSDVRGRSIVETDAAYWHEAIRDHHLNSPLPEILHQLTGSLTINFYSDQLFLNRLLKKSFPGLFHLSWATPTRVKSSIFMLDLRAIHPWMAYQAAFSAAC